MIKSAPVGPVAGGIMGCIMVLVLAVYAYRHQIHRRSHQHMSPLAAQGRSPASLHKMTNQPPMKAVLENQDGKLYQRAQTRFWADSRCCFVSLRTAAHGSFTTCTTSSGTAAPPPSHPLHTLPPPEMSVRMSNLDNERDERDEDSHEDRGISEFDALDFKGLWKRRSVSNRGGVLLSTSSQQHSLHRRRVGAPHTHPRTQAEVLGPLWDGERSR